MSPKKARLGKTVRGVDLTLRYSSDDGGTESLINQRQFFDENGFILGPITSKLLERQVQPSTPSIPLLGNVKPRRVITCFGSLVNTTGESNFTTIIPYSPTDISHSEHLREIFAYVSLSPNIAPSKPLNVSYYGECL